MLAAFRSFAKSWAAKGLLALLIVSFGIFFGANQNFRPKVRDAVITAGSRTVTPADFKNQFQNYHAEYQQQAGQPVPIDQFIKAGAATRLANEIAGRESFLGYISRIGVRPAESLVAEAIRQMPELRDVFNQVTGQFDKAAYEQKLAGIHMTDAQFRGELRDQIAASQFLGSMQAAARAPRVYGAVQSQFMLQTRDASWFPVDVRVAGMPAKPTDAQLQKLLTENADKLRVPEMRAMTVALFTPDVAAGSVKIDDAALRKRYDFRKDTLSQPEKRTFVQVTAPDAQAAARVAAALRAGQDPSAVAKANKGQAISYADKPRTAVPDEKVAQAAFSLQQGQVSDPVQGQLGFAVVKVASVTPGHEVTFEQARPQLEQELRLEAAKDKVYELVQQFQDAHDRGTKFDEAAKKVGARIVTIPLVSQQGQTADRQARNYPKPLMDTAFGLPKGGESDVEELGGGAYYAVRVDDVRPAYLPKLDEVRGPLTQVWMVREATRLIQAKADELAARVRKGESIEAVAKSVGAPLQTSQGVQRGGQQAVPQQLVQGIFSESKGGVFVTPVSQTALAVGRVDAVHWPAPVLAAQATEATRPGATRSLLQDMVGAAQEETKAIVKPKIFPAQINAALGVAAPETPAADAEKSKK